MLELIVRGHWLDHLSLCAVRLVNRSCCNECTRDSTWEHLFRNVWFWPRCCSCKPPSEAGFIASLLRVCDLVGVDPFSKEEVTSSPRRTSGVLAKLLCQTVVVGKPVGPPRGGPVNSTYEKWRNGNVWLQAFRNQETNRSLPVCRIWGPWAQAFRAALFMSSFERKQPKRLRNNSRGGGNGSGASVDGVCAGSATTAQSDAVAPRPPQLAVRRAMSRFFILQYVFPALAPQLLVAAPKPDYMVGVHFGHHEPDVSMRYRFVAAQTEARAENRTEQPAALHTRVAAPPCKLFVAFSDEDRNSCRLFRTSALLTPELYHPANHAGRAAAAARDSIEAARSIGLEVEEDNFSTFCVSIPWTFDVSCGLTHAEFNRERINRLRQHPGLNFLARLSRCVLSHPWMHDQYIARLEDSMRFEEEVRRAVAARLEHQLNVAVGRWVATSHGGSKAQMAKMYSFSKSLLSRVKSVQSSNKRICPPLDVAVGATVHLDADMPQPRGWAWPWIRYMRAARAGCGWRHVEGDAPDALGYSMRPYLVLRDWGKGQAATSHTEAGGPSGMAYIRAAPPPPVRRPRRQHRGGESDSLRAIASRLFRRAISFLLLHDARRRWPADQSDAYEICKGDACRWRMRDYWIPREALSHDNPVRKQWPLETLVQAVTMLPIVENRLLAAAAKYLRAAEVESVPFKSRASAAAQHGFGQMLPQKFDVPASAASSFRDVLFAVIQEQRR